MKQAVLFLLTPCPHFHRVYWDLQGKGDDCSLCRKGEARQHSGADVNKPWTSPARGGGNETFWRKGMGDTARVEDLELTGNGNTNGSFRPESPGSGLAKET